MPTPFQIKVYALCKQIPRGKVSTYKQIGDALGGKGQIYRAVGVALHKNPYAPDVPCHRVVSSDGILGGFAHGVAAKKRLLEKEGVAVIGNKIVDFERVLWRVR